MGRPSKDGTRRSVRVDPQLDAVLADECARLGIDVSSVMTIALRAHFGVGGPGCRDIEDRLRRARDAEPHLRAAFRLLSGTDPENFKDPADAIARLGAGPACEVFLGWWGVQRRD